MVLGEFQDHLARFGFPYLVDAFVARGGGAGGDGCGQALVADMLIIVTCFAARLFVEAGRRNSSDGKLKRR